MYSLVSAPVLGYDLVRNSRGARVATLLLAALEVTASDLPALARAGGGQPRTGTAAVVPEGPASTGGMVAALRRTTALLADDRAQEALALLETTAMVGPGGLEHFVRHEVFEWTWETGAGRPTQPPAAAGAVAAVLDLVVQAYAGSDADDPVVRLLLAATARRMAREQDPRRFGPRHEQVRSLLDRLHVLAPPDVAALREAADRSRRERWSTAVHSTTWAVHLAARVREAARVQLHAAETLATGPVGITDLATGTWNLVSGAAQALMVRDLLDEETTALLVAPAAGALGLVLPPPAEMG